MTAGIVSPYARGSLGAMRVRQAALDFGVHVRYAQMLAVDQERSTRIVVNREKRHYRIQLAKADGSGEYIGAPGIPGEVICLPKNVRFAEINITFPEGIQGEGFIFAPAVRWPVGVVVFTDGVEKWEVDVKPGVGHVEVNRRQAAAVEDTGEEENTKYRELLENPL